jgi:two-component system cell cycle sensor histidine kinase/response regulator CckA
MTESDDGGGPTLGPIGGELAALLLREALGKTTDGVIIADALGPDFPIIFVNDGFQRLTGYSEAEVLGRNCCFLQGLGTDPAAVAEMRDALAASRECRVRVLNYRKDGVAFWNEVRLSPVSDADGRTVRVVGVQQDVSGTVEAEAALRSEEADHRVLTDALDSGVVLVGPDGRVRAANAAAARMFGMDPAAMVGTDVTDPRGNAVRADGTELAGDEHPTTISLRTGRSLTGVVRGLRRPGGDILWISVNSRPLWRSGEEQPYAAVASFTDITEQRRAEAELRHRAEIIDQVDAGVIMLDAEGLVTQWNRAAERMYGWSCEEVLGTRVGRQIIPRDEREKAAYAYSEVEAGRSYEGEMRVRRRDGSEFSAYLRNVPVYDGDGTLEGFVGVSIDITEQERSRQALEESREALVESERRLRAVVGAAPMVLWALDAEGTVVLLEGQRLDAMGLTPETTIGRSVYDVCAELPAIADDNRRALGGEAFSSLPEVGGRCYETRYSPTVDDAGEVTAVVAVAIDVTRRVEDARERERLEARLRQAERLESVGQLAGGIAHDFNNLLAVILNYASFALEDGGKETIRDDMAEIRRAAERASALTRQLLLFSSRQLAEPTVIRIEAVIEDMGQLLDRTLGEDIRLERIIGPGEWPVRIDHGEVEQVVMNLALNARDAMPDGGTLTIETGSLDADEAEARGLPRGRYLCMRVRDTGHGMDEDVRTRVFEPFFSTKPRDKGSGLGLATVYGIAQRAEGHLQIESTPGQGTLVEFLLPAADGQPFEPTAPTSNGSAKGATTGARILLVEDEDTVREVVRRTLARLGYEVLEARDGREAVDLYDRHGAGIDLLLTDVVLPEMSGSEVVAHVRSTSPGLKVLFMSGYTDDDVLRRGVERGEVAFLSKPFTPHELQRRVEETLSVPR